MKMNILLVNPPCRIPILIPLGLGYIASTLRQAGHTVSLLDLNVERKSFDEIESLLSSSECDVIGIGGLSTTYSFVKQFSVLAKRVKPQAKLIAGNMVSTANPELLLQNSRVDICVIDEGEETARELMDKINDFPDIENVKGIIFKKNGRIIKTSPRKRIKDLDSIPFPAWDLFSIETYVANPIHSEYGRRSMNVSTVRGCPFQCIYCSRPFGSGVYMRSASSVISEIKALKRRYKIDFIGFSDDLFIINKRWVMGLCDALIKENIRIGWGASARVNLVDSDLLKRMKKAGCEALSYGFESGSQKMLDAMKKGVKVGQAEEAIRMTRKAGITIDGSFMIGMIGETEETVKETVDFIKRTGLALHRFFYTTPYPGTPLYEMAEKMNRMPPDKDRYIASLSEMYNTLLVNLTDMTNEELRGLKERAEKKIKENFSPRVKKEIFSDELNRISVNVKKRVKKNGIRATLNWSLGKIREKIKQ
jgi:radical SAM superfamily enzyme YgiQ (UPF0313 family)